MISILDAPTGGQVVAHGGGVLEVIREHRGDGLVIDHRPLILLENDRALSPAAVRADMISDVQRRFYVAAGAEVTGSKLRAHYQVGEEGNALEVARTDPETGDVLERLVHVDLREGLLHLGRGLVSDGGIHVRGRPVTLHPPRGEVEVAYTVEGTADGAVRVASTNPELPVTLAVDGHVAVAGDASIAGKLSVRGSIDPTDLTLTPQRSDPIGSHGHGLWVSDGTVPGTVKGGLYYQRAGERVRLDA